MILCRASPQLPGPPPLSIVNYLRQACGKESGVIITLKVPPFFFNGTIFKNKLAKIHSIKNASGDYFGHLKREFKMSELLKKKKSQRFKTVPAKKRKPYFVVPTDLKH